jgi:hypothetical protein
MRTAASGPTKLEAILGWNCRSGLNERKLAAEASDLSEFAMDFPVWPAIRATESATMEMIFFLLNMAISPVDPWFKFAPSGDRW